MQLNKLRKRKKPKQVMQMQSLTTSHKQTMSSLSLSYLGKFFLLPPTSFAEHDVI